MAKCKSKNSSFSVLNFRSLQTTQVEATLERHRSENNGYVKLAERLDWFFMIIFLTLLTIPVIYLYFNL